MIQLRTVLVPRRGTRNDVDIDFTTDGLVPPLFLPSFERERETVSLACSIVVVAVKEAATRNVSFPERRLRKTGRWR